MDRPRSWHSQAIELSVEPTLRIGGATIDPISRDAIFAAGTERLQPQNLKVLIALARGQGRVVTRADLIDLCWDGRIVGEDVINHAISVLRAFAGRAGGFSIETVPKAGYRLIVTGSILGAGSGRRRWVAGIGALLLLTIALVINFRVPPSKQGEPPTPTVALAPFKAPAGDAAAAELARSARTSLAHMLTEAGFPIRLTDEHGKRADFIISGDIERDSGGVAATVRMEQARDHVVVFTHRFESPLKEVSNLPDQIGASIATNLSWTAPLMALDRRHPSNPEITSELLRQMAITVEGGDMLRAYEIARETAKKAPNSAIAQLALAFDTGFALPELPREQRGAAVVEGRTASERAIRLAPEFGDVYIPWCILHSSAWMAQCEARLREAQRRYPDAPFPSSFLCTLMSNVGRNEDALTLARITIANDPFKPAKFSKLMMGLQVMGQREEAVQVYARGKRWWPMNERIVWGRMLGFIMSGEFGDLENFALQDREKLQSTARLLASFRARDIDGVKQDCRGDAGHPSTHMLCPILLADLGEYDAAFAKADQMFPTLVGRTREEEERLWLDNPGGYPPAILLAPSAAALRRDPRFLELARRTGLLRYWRTVQLPDFCTRGKEGICARITR